jgi:hypothetical protein
VNQETRCPTCGGEFQVRYDGVSRCLKCQAEQGHSTPQPPAPEPTQVCPGEDARDCGAAPEQPVSAAQKGYQFNPCWDAVENYGAFRKEMGIESGNALTFHQWMRFAESCRRAGISEAATNDAHNIRRTILENCLVTY